MDGLGAGNAPPLESDCDCCMNVGRPSAHVASTAMARDCDPNITHKLGLSGWTRTRQPGSGRANPPSRDTVALMQRARTRPPSVLMLPKYARTAGRCALAVVVDGVAHGTGAVLADCVTGAGELLRLGTGAVTATAVT